MLLFALLLVAQTADTTAADSSRRDIIYYGGKTAIFSNQKQEVVLLDSAWVRYHDMSVHSDSIHYDVKRHQLSAFKDVLFTSGSDNFTGELLVYDVDTRKGMMRTAYTHVENGFFRADEVWLVRERVLNARGASYTTCDLPHPHYAFYGPRTKLLMDDVAIAEPMVFKLFNTPILAVPFWMVPVASKRKSGFMPFKIGNSSTEGFYSKNIAYYLVINDYSDMTFYGDVMTKRGLQGRVEGVYVVTPFAQGNINGSYINEWDTRRRRYSVSAAHRSDRFFFDSQLDGKLELASDATYIPDYSEDQLEWLKPDLFSYGQITKSLRRVGSVTVLAQQKTEFSSHTRWADLPSVRLSVSQRPLFGGWNLSPSASFLHHTQDYLDSTNSTDTARTRALTGNAAVGISSPAYKIGPLGSATVSERVALAEGRKYYDDTLNLGQSPRSISSGFSANMDQRFLGTFGLTEAFTLTQSDNLRDSSPVKAAYSGSVTARATFYRVFGVTSFGMRGLLHTVTPTAALSYQPKVDSGPLFGRPHPFDPQVAQVNFGLGNTFQAKVDTAGTKRDLGTINFTTSYNLLDSVRSPRAGYLGTAHEVLNNLTPLRGVLSVRPLQSSNLNLSIDASAGFDFDSLDFRKDYSVATTFYLNRIGTDSARSGRGFQLSLNHTYIHGSSGSATHMITGNAALAVPGWKLTLTDFGYNFAQKQVANYGLMLTKDLHCWEAFAKLQKLGTRWSYDFEVRIKKLPDIKIGKGTFGSILPKIGE
ncbi:LPS-assembly protein LptD [candidate division WOR-3 bacterium]|nr:LPS-assembly protein LptD [candidate division WOR-3 bacterium]